MRFTISPRMQGVLVASSLVLASGVQAGTVAYWRFEAGPAGSDITHGAADGVFATDIPDSSGNGNGLSVWQTGGGGGYRYSTDLSSSTVAQTGAVNNFSAQNTGGGPAMFTETGGFLQTWSPTAFTFEAAIKPEQGGWRTIIGRDSQGANTTADANLAAMYFQITPDDALAFKYTDVDGNFHDATSAPGLIQTFPFPETQLGTWQYIAAVSDGANLTVYLDSGAGYSAVQSIALGAGNTAMHTGAGDGGDWDPGNFSVGRGLYAGGHGDRAYGFIDEVRFSDEALSPTQFLNAIPEPGATLLAGLGALSLGLRRRR